MRGKLLVAVALTVPLAFVGCTKKTTDGDGEDGGEIAQTGTKEVGDTGTIKGTVKFSGTKPERRKLDTSSDDVCHAAHEASELLSEEVVVNDNGTLRWAVVSVNNDQVKDYKFKRPKDEVKVDQHGCQYKPHIVSVMAGQKVAFHNSDQTTHNVHGIAEADGNSSFNEMSKAGSSPIMKRFKAHEYMRVKCDVHPWMESFIAVFPHPLHDVTEEDGAFEISGVPVGEYDLEVWHQKYGSKKVKVKVEKDKTATVEVSYTAG